MVVNFTASWCGPCRFISPFLGELAKMLPDVAFVKVDVDELKVIPIDSSQSDELLHINLLFSLLFVLLHPYLCHLLPE